MQSNPRPRVLCVDDDEDSRMMLTALLRLSFIEATAVGTGGEALSLMQSERFDLYLLDAWLPGIDGFELCRRILASYPQAPIIFFSGAAFEADRKRGLEAGAVAYVIKPDLDGLLDSLMRLFGSVGISVSSAVLTGVQQASDIRKYDFEFA